MGDAQLLVQQAIQSARIARTQDPCLGAVGSKTDRFPVKVGEYASLCGRRGSSWFAVVRRGSSWVVVGRRGPSWVVVVRRGLP